MKQKLSRAAQALMALPVLVMASAAHAQSDSPILDAVNWMHDTLLGTVATVVASVAVAAVGFMMLTGRMNWKYGATVILGVFIIFGASTIVGSIQSHVH